MKKIKMVVLLFVFSIFAFSTTVNASEIENPVENMAQPAYYELNSEFPEVNQVLEYYNGIIESLTADLNAGLITTDYYNEQLALLDADKNTETALIEEELIQEENESNIGSISNEDTHLNKVTMIDENGEVIKDYTDVDFSDMDNKRTITFVCRMEDGTMPDSNFYIKIKGSAINLIYEAEIILDESNNFTAKMDLPNDLYSFEYDYSKTADSVSYEDGFIDVSSNPTQEIFVYGSRSIITNRNEIIKIEGTEYVEPVEEEVLDYTTAIKIISVIVVVFAVIGFVVFILKKKRDNEF